jgi:hypothetical protein
MVGNGELLDLMKSNFLLMNEHHFSLSEIEDMVPYEREIYIMLLLDHLERKKKNLQQGQ